MTKTLTRRSVLTQSGLLLGATTLDLVAAPAQAQRPANQSGGTMVRLIANENRSASRGH
jgi:hypothetical protein